jgi:hypothetical protein
MQKHFAIFSLIVLSGLISVQAQEKMPAQTEKHVQSVPTKEGNSTLMMKIKSDEKGDELRRQELVDELKKLYKANFL